MKKFFKGLLMSVLALAVGFLALAFPFHLFDELSSTGIQVLFISEIVIYLTLGMLFLVAKQKKADRKAKEKERIISRREKFKKAQEKYYSLAA